MRASHALLILGLLLGVWWFLHTGGQLRGFLASLADDGLLAAVIAGRKLVQLVRTV